jgi:hypothetical protein
MPIQVTCSSCDQTLAAPEAMAGKRVICPHCQGAVDIPQSGPLAPRVESGSPSDAMDEPVVVGALNIAKTAENDAQTADEKAALRILRFFYLMIRDDWRRLFTCPLLWPGLLLFFLPWVDLSCAPRTIATQTGLQTTYGAYTLDPKFEKVMRLDRAGLLDNALRPKADDRAPWSVLSIIYIVFLFMGAFFGFVGVFFVLFRVRTFAAAMHLFSLGLGSAAFIAIALQMMIGFPIQRHAQEHVQKAMERNRQVIGMRPVPPQELELLELETHYSVWLWISAGLAGIAVPVFMLEFCVLLALVVRHFRKPHLETG